MQFLEKNFTQELTLVHPSIIFLTFVAGSFSFLKQREFLLLRKTSEIPFQPYSKLLLSTLIIETLHILFAAEPLKIKEFTLLWI